MSAIHASGISREAFEKALTIATEGKDLHGLYAIEDAQALLEPIAKFYWRQFTLNLILVIAIMNAWVGMDLPWYAPVLGIFGSALITFALMRAPLVGKTFAPPGYTSQDVARAHTALLSTHIQR
ncbi:MAG: hypothetical protein R3C27_07715 [Hyphomonadaceae bacterium]